MYQMLAVAVAFAGKWEHLKELETTESLSSSEASLIQKDESFHMIPEGSNKNRQWTQI